MNDCAAALWVIQKRATKRGVTFLDMLHAYSALDARNPRALRVRSMPPGDVPGWTARLNRKWAALGVAVDAFFDGRTPDPFPRAEHWGGTCDAVSAREVVEGVIKNRFVRYRRAKP